MTQKVVIIGAGAVGMTVATFLGRHTDFDIAVFSSDSHTAYSQCGMPYVLGSRILDLNDLIIKPQESFAEMGINLYLKTPINHIDIPNQKLIARAGIFEYDHLVIATGAVPFIPPIQGNELDRVFTLHTLSDGIKINEVLHDSNNILIIGAGSIGTELAACLATRGIKITLIEAMPQVLGHILDPDMASVVQHHLISLGVRVITQTEVAAIKRGDHNYVGSVIVDNKILPVDCVIIAAGVRPQVDLALRAGLDIGSTGGIVTDKYLRVSLNNRFLNNVYAGGDCAQVSNFITGSPIIAGLGPAARRMARVIGENISKKSSSEASIYPSTLSPTVIAIKDLAAGSVGITSHTAEKHNIQVVSGISKGYTKASYCPDAGPLHIKLLFLRQRLIGAQVVAKEGVKERIDALGLAIRMGATIDDLIMWETSYAPPVSMVIDPVTLAAYNVKKKMVE